MLRGGTAAQCGTVLGDSLRGGLKQFLGTLTLPASADLMFGFSFLKTKARHRNGPSRNVPRGKDAASQFTSTARANCFEGV